MVIMFGALRIMSAGHFSGVTTSKGSSVGHTKQVWGVLVSEGGFELPSTPYRGVISGRRQSPETPICGGIRSSPTSGVTRSGA